MSLPVQSSSLTLARFPALAVSLRAARLVYSGLTLFDGLDLELAGGCFTGLLGPSGIGKSSLLRLLAGLTSPGISGQLQGGDGQALTGRVAYMAQQDLLLPWLSVLDNVILGSRLRGERPDQSRALDLLAQVGLAEVAAARPDTLSGGMRQRVALARTLMEDRPVVLMDEPFSGLDALNRLRLQALAAELLSGRTVLLVTHDPLEALRLGEHILIMNGRPATLSALPDLPGVPPRDPGDPNIQETYRTILRRLEAVSITPP
ncbi:MAG: transporter ATP-binding protein [Pseudomonadota bacterium]|nr:transporter ATP-binding protein [Pseudomonadota bacterium]